MHPAAAVFLNAVSPLASYHPLLDQLPGVAFFAKDCDGRITGANRLFYERFGAKTEQEIFGKSDFDLFPERLALHFREDDQEVIKSARPKLHIVELFFNRQGIPDWYLTHKFPAYDRDGRIIGIVGFTQNFEGNRQAFQPYLSIDKAVKMIREQYMKKITVADLATHVGLSQRQLQRRFIESFDCSPQAFILKVRLQAACELLQRDECPLGQIAESSGFADQSSFTQHFRKHIGVTPRKYQNRFRIRRDK